VSSRPSPPHPRMTTSPQLLDPALPGLCIAQPARAERFFVEGDRVRVGGHQTRGGGQVLFCGKNGEARITAAMRPENSWAVERGPDGVLRWVGESAVYAHEPQTGFWTRFKAGLIGLLPIEKYL